MLENDWVSLAGKQNNEKKRALRYKEKSQEINLFVIANND